MKDFIKDPDPETDINLGSFSKFRFFQSQILIGWDSSRIRFVLKTYQDGDLRKINYVLRQMKKHINMGGSMDTILNDQGSANTGQSGQAGGANGQKQFQITPEEVIRMKDILEQRDAEITVLVSFFLKIRNFIFQ